MPAVVVTRLRLRDPEDLDDFFAAAVTLLEQAKQSPGALGSDGLAEANNTWWSQTAWSTRDAMRAYVNTHPHHATMSRLDDWCDEASFADWDQDTAALPDWQTAFRRLVAEGKSATLTHASPENDTLTFPAPVEPRPTA